MTPETEKLSPEQQQAQRQIAGFFGRAESEFPAAAGQLVNVVGGLVGDQQMTQEKLKDGMGNIEVGLALIGDWLKEMGAEGFNVNLGFGGGAKKAIGRSKVEFPTVSDLIRVWGRVNPELQKQIPRLLSSFSRQIKGGLDVGLSPRQIVGGLVAESVGSRLSANGSATLRSALERPLGGHFEWIREALGIADVASQAGFIERVEAPKGYKLLDRDSAAFLEVGRQGTRFYIGRHPADLVCDEEGNFYFRLSEVPWPEQAEYMEWFFRNNNPDDVVERVAWGGVPENGVALTSGRDVYLEIRPSAGYGDKIEIINHELAYLVSKKDETTIFLPYEVKVGGKTQSFADICDGIGMVQLRRENGKVRVVRRSGAGNKISIFVPSAAVIRPGVAEEEKAERLDFNRRTDEARRLAEQAREEKQAEVELTLKEKVFVAQLEDLVGWEEGVGVIDSGKLQKAFENMRSQFGRLPVGGHFRDKVMENVMGQLGDEGEKLRKTGRKDEQIFEEWLKQVFLPLYRRMGKKR